MKRKKKKLTNICNTLNNEFRSKLPAIVFEGGVKPKRQVKQKFLVDQSAPADDASKNGITSPPSSSDNQNNGGSNVGLRVGSPTPNVANSATNSSTTTTTTSTASTNSNDNSNNSNIGESSLSSDPNVGQKRKAEDLLTENSKKIKTESTIDISGGVNGALNSTFAAKPIQTTPSSTTNANSSSNVNNMTKSLSGGSGVVKKEEKIVVEKPPPSIVMLKSDGFSKTPIVVFKNENLGYSQSMLASSQASEEFLDLTSMPTKPPPKQETNDTKVKLQFL